MEFTAPAKINLYLKVLSRREDGYDEIETLFERVSLYDRISAELAESGTTISCGDPRVPTGEGSLLRKVINEFNRETGKTFCFKVVVEKNIPLSAGLGGGSSDAAALLKALNGITGSPLDDEALLGIARRLGADVPFFLSEASFAFGKGRGDIINEVRTPLKMWHVVVNPPFEISTQAAYGKLPPFTLTKDKGVDRMFTAFLNEKRVEGIAENLHNDLQQIALRDFPVLKQVLSELKRLGAKGALLSGSGPSVFGIFDQEKAEAAKDTLLEVFPAEKNWKIWAVHTC